MPIFFRDQFGDVRRFMNLQKLINKAPHFRCSALHLAVANLHAVVAIAARTIELRRYFVNCRIKLRQLLATQHRIEVSGSSSCSGSSGFLLLEPIK